jgi:hypothetical protein
VHIPRVQPRLRALASALSAVVAGRAFLRQFDIVATPGLVERGISDLCRTQTAHSSCTVRGAEWVQNGGELSLGEDARAVHSGRGLFAGMLGGGVGAASMLMGACSSRHTGGAQPGAEWCRMI